MHFGIIAAGEGSRLAHEGVKVSKPLLPICGTPMIRRLIDIYSGCGADSINVVINEFMTDVRDYLFDLKGKMNIPLNIGIRTTPSSMHTFHELSKLLPDRGRFIVTTVDTIFRETDFMKYVRAFRETESMVDGMMAVTSYIEDEKPLYVNVDNEMNIKAFLDKPEVGIKYVSGGIYGLDGKAVDVLDKCLGRGVSRMRNFQRCLIEEGLNIKGWDMGKIVDVDHVSDIESAQRFLECEV